MLMALLPLAGWAQNTASFGDVTFGVYYYGDANWPAIQVKDGDGEILTKDTDYENDGKVYSDADCTTEVTAGESMVAGDTPYYVKVTGKAGTVYEGLSKVAYFTVQKCPITLVFTSNCLNRTYGDDALAVTANMVSGTTLKYSQTIASVLKGTVPTYTTADNNVGSDKAVTFVTPDGSWYADNYEFTYPTDFKLTISAKSITPTLTVTGTYTYTGVAQTPTFTVKDGTTDVTDQYELKYSTDNGSNWTAIFKDYATYTIKAVPVTNSNYSGESATQTLAIAQQPLTVYVVDFEREYTGSDATLTGDDVLFAYSGLVGDDASKTAPFGANAYTAEFASGTSGSHKNVASYNVKPKAGTLSGNHANYDITLSPAGKVTVTPKAITIKPTANQTKAYGEDDPTFTVDASSALSGDQTNVAAAYTVSRTDASDNTVGTHEGVLTLTKKADSSLSTDVKTTLANYTITTATADFEITAATLYVYPKAVNITYGDEAPALELATSIEGVTLTSTPTVKFKDYATAPTDAGTYVLTLDGTAAADGYTVVPLDGQYIIATKALTPVIAVQQVALNAEATALDQTKVTFTGLVNEDLIGYNLKFDTSVTTNSDNTYPAGIAIETKTVENMKNANYTIDWTQTGKLIVGNGTAVAINFTSANDDATTIANHAGETQDVTIKFDPRNGRNYGSGDTYSWKAGQWTTMVLPFDISVADLSKALGYAIVNVINPEKTVVSGTESKFYGKLTMTGGNGNATKLAANKPFLIKLAEDINPSTTYNFGKQTIVAPTDLSVNAGGNCTFVGTYTSKTVTSADNAAVWFMNGDEDGWQYIGASSSATWTIVPFEAYIDMSAVPAAARNLIFYVEDIDGTVTAINDIKVDGAAAAAKVADGWYTLNGVKLNGAPTQKGIYINNGKKVVIK